MCALALGLGCGKKQAPSGQDAEPIPFASVKEVRLPAPPEQAASYLGIPAGATDVALTKIGAEILLIQVFDMYCMNCQREAPDVNALYERVQGSDLAKRVRFLGIGKGNTQTEVRIYHERYKVPFPLFADPNKKAVNQMGIDRTPTFVIVDLKRQRVLHEQWRLESAESMFERLRKAGG